ncbi:hypothetical protein DFJ74DRAFT_768789 [Hyaloraphidium curvatum]|nr:hypothetical protein DFJ74DRAFT_768789 [Hyaloraphidium curvatum]
MRPAEDIGQRAAAAAAGRRGGRGSRGPRGVLRGALLLAALAALAAPALSLDLTNSLVVDIIRADAGQTTLLREYIVLNSSINPLPGSPSPPPEGTRGQMVNFDACNPTPLRPTVFSDLGYVALIANLSAPCPLEQKLAAVTADPLVKAAVFYDYSFPNVSETDWIPQSFQNFSIPFYWMEGSLGSDYSDLLDRVYRSYPPGTYVGSTTVLIIGTLFGRTVVLPSVSMYKQTLFIAGIVVVGVMLLGFGYFMWRSRKRGWWAPTSSPGIDLELLQRTLANAQAAAANAPKLAVLTQRQLDMLPLKTFDDEPRKSTDTRRSFASRKSVDARKSLEAASALAAASAAAASSSAPALPAAPAATPVPSPSAASLSPPDAGVDAPAGPTLTAPGSCPICLDPPADLPIRFLPCSHAFHAACVDVWLLEKSAMCPLCRADCRPEDEREEAQQPEAPVQQPADGTAQPVPVQAPVQAQEEEGGNVFRRMYRRTLAAVDSVI